MAGTFPTQRLRAGLPLTRVDDYPLSDELLDQLDALIDRQLDRLATASQDNNSPQEPTDSSAT